MKRLLFLLSFLFCHVLALTAQFNPDRLYSPYQVVATHLKNLNDENYEPEIAAMTFHISDTVFDDRQQLAAKLLQIYRGAGILIDLENIPNEPDYLDSLSGRHIYRITKSYPDIYVEKVGEHWYYSSRTAERIDEIHKSLYPFGVDKIMELAPKLGDNMYLGLHLWQYIFILIIILLSVFIHKVFTLVIENIIIKFLIRRGKKEVAKSFVAPVAKPMSILILFPILLVLIPVIQLPININTYLILALKAIWPVFLTIVAYRLVDIVGAYMVRLADKTESTLDDQLVPMVRKALKIFVIIVGMIVILMNLNIDIVPLLTGLSIGGLAFALAAQDTLKNFFGSIMIFIDKPFQIGDWITSGDIDGTVEEVGFRATRVRTFRNSVTYVPNGMIADRTVDNHGLRRYRRFYTKIAITYDTPSDLINVFVEGLRNIVLNHPHTWKENFHVYLNDMADSSLSVMFYIFFKAPTWGDELRYRHEVLIEIIRLAESIGINFAFPTRTLHMETFPEKKGNSPEYENDSSMLKKQLQAFLKKPKSWDQEN